MTIARMYAEALYRAHKDKPLSKLLPNLLLSLKRRGHTKLLPRVMAEYEKLLEREERTKEYSKVTPESEQTRVLLELYQKLVSNHG